MSKGTTVRKSKNSGEGGRRKPQPGRFEASSHVATAEAVPREEIARRAYALFLERGARHGDDLADWLRAEAELARGRNAGQS
jgi:hypothetical protein